VSITEKAKELMIDIDKLLGESIVPITRISKDLKISRFKLENIADPTMLMKLKKMEEIKAYLLEEKNHREKQSNWEAKK